MKISLVIPAYNEEKTMRKTLEAYKAYLEKLTDGRYEIIAVNDGSIDKTKEEIKKTDGVICVSYDKNRGKGYAVRRGVLRASGDYIFFTDADLSYAPACIKAAMEKFKADGANIVVGERRDRKKEYSPLRRIASGILRRLLKRVVGINSPDSQCGFKGFDKKTARQIFSRMECEDFGFDFEILSIAEGMGKKCVSLPLDFTHRKATRVKLFSDSLHMIKSMVRLSARNDRQSGAYIRKREKILLFTLFFLLSIYRLSYMGYNYTPYLDDSVQYMLYPSLDNPWQRVLAGGAGVLFTRPLAGLMDFFVWSKFDGYFGAAVVIISAMYAFSALLFYKIFAEIGIQLTPCFLVFYAFMPINTEGTYWLSASSRIVVSLFLVSLCCFLLIRGEVFWFWLCNIAAMGFYEQTAVLAVVLPFIICIFKRREKPNPKIIALPVINVTLLAIYYMYFGKMSNNSGRIGVKFSELPERLAGLVSENTEMWGRAATRLTLNGFRRGVAEIMQDGAYLWLLVLVILVFLWFLAVKRESFECSGKSKKIWLGLILATVPMLPFLISRGNLNFRNAVPTLLGVALILDAVVPIIFKKSTAVFLTACLVCFTITAVSEVSDYDLTARRDMEIIELAAQNAPPEYGTDFEAVVCSCTAPTRFEQNAAFNDHIISIRGSAWGITGPVRAMILKNK